MSASFPYAPPSKISDADHHMLPARRVVPPGRSEDVTISSSGIIASRLKPAKTAQPVLSIRTFGLGAKSVSRVSLLVGTTTYPLNISMNYSLVMQIDQPLVDVCKLQ